MTTPLNVEHYKARLLELEQSLASRAERALAAGRNEFIEIAPGPGDPSLPHERAPETFTETRVGTKPGGRNYHALARVNDGTYGVCVVDGGAIDPKRLDAVPWTPFCLRHAESAVAMPKARVTL